LKISIPPGAQWLTLSWLALYLPVYTQAYGVWHFFQLCNAGLIISCFAILSRQQLFISSQALGSSGIGLFWVADQLAWIGTGQPLHGGTAYLWQSSIPPLARILSIYHVVLPLILLWIVYRRGYERRAWLLQCSILAGTGLIGVWFAPATENINYVFYWPDETVSYTISWPRLITMFLVVSCALYWPLHRLLMHWQTGKNYRSKI
jgi:hypothetical protein